MRNGTRLALLALLTLIVAAACLPGARRGGERPAGTYLLVDNQSPVQVTVYVLRDAERRRLGTASSLGTTRLRIPDNLIFGATPLRFELSPLASRSAPITERITVTEGQEVRLRIPASFR